MPRFYLTTAIDYVNNRPHLGTAYEKIAADVIARYKRLAGVRRALRHGQRRALAERLPQARTELGLEPLAYCDRMEDEFRDGLVAAEHLVRRLHPDDRAAAQGRGRRRSSSDRTSAGDIYEGVYEGWYCVSCEAFKQEKDLVDGLCPIHRDEAGLDQGEELLLPAVGLPRPAARALRRASGVRRAGVAPERDAAAARRRPRGHLGQPRRTGVGHSAAVRSDERRVRLVRRAHQLRRGRRATAATRRCSTRGGRPTCT